MRKKKLQFLSGPEGNLKTRDKYQLKTKTTYQKDGEVVYR